MAIFQMNMGFASLIQTSDWWHWHGAATQVKHETSDLEFAGSIHGNYAVKQLASKLRQVAHIRASVQLPKQMKYKHRHQE